MACVQRLAHWDTALFVVAHCRWASRVLKWPAAGGEISNVRIGLVPWRTRHGAFWRTGVCCYGHGALGLGLLRTGLARRRRRKFPRTAVAVPPALADWPQVPAHCGLVCADPPCWFN